MPGLTAMPRKTCIGAVAVARSLFGVGFEDAESGIPEFLCSSRESAAGRVAVAQERRDDGSGEALPL
jgi:hypothetical protein